MSLRIANCLCRTHVAFQVSETYKGYGGSNKAEVSSTEKKNELACSCVTLD